MHAVYGESGNGKTTMLREGLRSIQPFPYILLDFEFDTTWAYICNQMGISEIFVSCRLAFKESLENLLEELSLSICPVIVIDHAEKKPNMTREIIEIVKNIPLKVSILLVFSGEIPRIGNAGGRILFEELKEPSLEFGFHYLKDLNITDPILASEILKISGTKVNYLNMLSAMSFSMEGKIDLDAFQKLIHRSIEFNFLTLSPKVASKILNIASTLLKQNKQVFLHNLPDEMVKEILTSNILRRTDLIRVDFQNRATRNYFELNLDLLLEQTEN